MKIRHLNISLSDAPIVWRWEKNSLKRVAIQQGLFDALMSLLSHDNWEVEYEYADTTSTGIKTKTNVLRGWPVMIFAQALDFTHYQRYPEIKRRFIIANPKMDKDKYKAAIDLIGKKFSLPNFVYESLVVSKSEKEKVREIIAGLREKILNICDAIPAGDNNVIVPFQERIITALRSDKAHDMTIAYRLFSYLSLLPAINIEQRPRMVFRKKGEPITQVMPFATYKDLKEAMFLMEYVDGVRPYISDRYRNVFLKTFNEKTGPDCKLVKKDDLREEDRKALTTQELVEATKKIQSKTLTAKKILETNLEPLMNEGYIDKQESNINHRNNIYYPIVSDSEVGNSRLIFDDFFGRKSNIEYENGGQGKADFEHELTPEYIKAKIEQVLSYSIGTEVFCEIHDSRGRNLTTEELIEKHYGIPPKPTETETAPDIPASDMSLEEELFAQHLIEQEQQDRHDYEVFREIKQEEEKNSEKRTTSIEQEKEQESSPVDQTEATDIRLDPNRVSEYQNASSIYKLDDNGGGSGNVWACHNCWKRGSREFMDKHICAQGGMREN